MFQTIICDKREFHCHKFMLAARSEVFAAMLRHEFLEKQNSRVDVKEIEGETMELLLSYIYTGQVSDFKSVSVVELFKAADRYRLDHLKHMCEEELVNRVEAANAADILSLAHKVSFVLITHPRESQYFKKSFHGTFYVPHQTALIVYCRV